MADFLASKPDFSQGVWAEQGELSEPSTDKIEVGHVVEKPPFQLANWIENRQDQGILYLLQNGLGSWDRKTLYPNYALVMKDGTVYQALQQNIKQDPSSATDYWVKAFYSKTDGDALKKIVDSILNTDGYVPFYVKKSEPIMDATSKGVGYAFKTADTTGLFLNDGGNAIINKGGVETHSFEKISDVFNESNDKVVRMSDLRKLFDSFQGFPVGSIFITTSNKSPASDLGYGTWEKFSQGRVLVGHSEAGDDPNWTRNNGTVYGEYNHKLTSDEIPSHDHTYGDKVFNKFTAIAKDVLDKYNYTGAGAGLTVGPNDKGAYDTQTMVADFINPYFDYSTVRTVGNDQAHNNVQPSLVVFMWRRTS